MLKEQLERRRKQIEKQVEQDRMDRMVCWKILIYYPIFNTFLSIFKTKEITIY